MAYTKQGFYSGEKLMASQLDAMEDGIIAAETYAANALANTLIMEKGSGESSVQQPPRAGKVTQAEGETTLHFDFIGYERAKEITGKASDESIRMQYGAIGNHSASMNGRSAALNKHAFATNNSTVAKGEESFAAGYETIAEGNGSAAFGSRTWAKGTESHTEGILTLTEGQAAHAEGSLTKAIGTYSHAEGYMTETQGSYSHTEGSVTKTGGFSAHAEGNDTIADTNASHTEGSGTRVISYMVVDESGDNGSTGGMPEDIPSYDKYESIEDFRVRYAACSHAEGNNTTAMGYGSHAEGVGTKAYGRSSHAEGWCTQTGELIEGPVDGQTYKVSNPEKGMAAHADGYNTKAIANYSHASGFETIASRDAQTVVGKYNNETSRDGSLFVVGAGESASKRKNALEVISDGEIVVYWEGNYYSLNLMFNLIANKFGGPTFFDLAKRQ